MSAVLIPVLQSGGSVAAVLTAFSAVAHKFLRRFIKDEASALVKTAMDVAITDLKSEITQRFDKADQQKADIAKKQDEMALHLATQFGGNGGGMREAINALQVSVARLEGQVQAQLQAQAAAAAAKGAQPQQ